MNFFLGQLLILFDAKIRSLLAHRLYFRYLLLHMANREALKFKELINWAVVVAQLVEWSLPIPEVRGSNPVIGKSLFIY